jgi:SAM-dependent MidA family methyltransferase
MNITNTPGLAGDYYTSPCITPVFGELIARQIIQMWEIMKCNPFSIIEYGGADGKLCNDILNYIQINSPVFYKNLNYHLIDVRIKRPDCWRHKNVERLTTGQHLQGLSGCVLSNELIDNFPVHQVIQKEKLMEVFVDIDGESFTELLYPADPSLENYFSMFDISLPDDYRTEINLDALQWISEISSVLESGYILTLYYGFDFHELYSLNRREGTLVCYHNNTKNFDPYLFPGEQDITTHVNFSALVQGGNVNGLDFTGYTNQCFFLQSLGLTSLLFKRNNTRSTCDQKIPNSFFSEFSRTIKVLIQQKNLRKEYLQGLNFQLKNPFINASPAGYL